MKFKTIFTVMPFYLEAINICRNFAGTDWEAEKFEDNWT